MNCKPGDFAVVVNLTNDDLRPYLGRIVEVESLVDEWCWKTHPELEPGRAVYDGALRPFRDPGEDAVDETLQRLPAPSWDEVMA